MSSSSPGPAAENGKAAMQDLRTAAHNTFQKLKNIFPDNDNYWRLGHSFDTIIDYLVTNPADADGVAEIGISAYQRTQGSWYDDYGWWGIASLKASQHADLFGSSNAAVFKGYALDCWKSMDENAPHVWERADQQKYARLKPLISGGVWNRDFDMCHTSDGVMCGIQNTVTNSLYLILSSRLYLAGQVSAEPSEREYTFLNNWFGVQQPGVDPLISNNNFVRERVTAYASGSKTDGYRPELAWAGDQGLVCGGLVDRARIVGTSSPIYPILVDTVIRIVKGSIAYLAPQNILKSWNPDPPPGGEQYREDYSTGIAVLMRYLLYIYENNLHIQVWLSSYRSFISMNAQYVIQNPASDQDLVSLTNDLATLTTAIVMLSTTE